MSVDLAGLGYCGVFFSSRYVCVHVICSVYITRVHHLESSDQEKSIVKHCRNSYMLAIHVDSAKHAFAITNTLSSHAMSQHIFNPQAPS